MEVVNNQELDHVTTQHQHMVEMIVCCRTEVENVERKIKKLKNAIHRPVQSMETGDHGPISQNAV